MFNLPDFSIVLAYLLCILSAVLCVVYGVINWNKGAGSEPDQISEELEWEKKEVEIDDTL